MWTRASLISAGRIRVQKNCNLSADEKAAEVLEDIMSSVRTVRTRNMSFIGNTGYTPAVY
jgi:hypothetical protein